MKMPFPGIDPYLEHPILWEPVHVRLINAIAEQLQPNLDPRYITSIEERVYLELPPHRVPDVKMHEVASPGGTVAVAEPVADTAVMLCVGECEVRQGRVEILDSYNDLKLVAVIEVVSPTNKAAGPGRESYLSKQAELLARDCHLIEIDLIRRGAHVLAIPEWRIVQESLEHEYLGCVSRFPKRNWYEVYPIRLRHRLPRIKIPLSPPDPDVALDLQSTLERVYEMGRCARRLKYHEPCVPRLFPTTRPGRTSACKPTVRLTRS
jgi:hypothetical protein